MNSGGYWLPRLQTCGGTDLFSEYYSWGAAWDCSKNVICYSQNAGGIQGIMCQVERRNGHMLRANVYIVYQNSSLGPWHCDNATGTSKNGSLKILADGQPLFCTAIPWPGGGYNEPNCKIECYLP
ncbi:MAG: hypothetical protein PHW63_10235 [Alphaproteobacteria bacterium]|nr:hypothetical protein [Alphaproteobacteria bacterium]